MYEENHILKTVCWSESGVLLMLLLLTSPAALHERFTFVKMQYINPRMYISHFPIFGSSN